MSMPILSNTIIQRPRWVVRSVAALATLAAMLLVALGAVSAQSPAQQPTTISVGAVTNTTIAVSWTADTRSTRFVVVWWPQGNRSLYQMMPLMQQTDTYTVRDLEPGTRYIVRVQPSSESESFPAAQVIATTTQPARTADPCPSKTDYDSDNDGLIEVCNLEQLDAIRHDLDGDGVADVEPRPEGAPSDFTWAGKDVYYGETRGEHPYDWKLMYLRGDYTDAERVTLYVAAFPNANANMGCYDDAQTPQACRGYELAANLDFDENGNGARDDTYNSGVGWRPIMGKAYIGYGDLHWHTRFFSGPGRASSDIAFNRAKMFRAVFEGNGRTISNLYVNRPETYGIGLFGHVGPGAQLRNVGLISPYIRGYKAVGPLAGYVEKGSVSGSYTRNVDAAGKSNVGGLLGGLWRRDAKVRESYATGLVYGSHSGTGGLIGLLNGWAQGRWSKDRNSVGYTFASVHVVCAMYCRVAGGLGGFVPSPSIHASYSTGAVERVDGGGGGWLGGIAGEYQSAGWGEKITNSYTTGRISGDLSDTVGAVIAWCTNKPPKNVRWNTYWNTETTLATVSPCSLDDSVIERKTTADLTAPTSATGIYQHWGPVQVGDATIPVWDFGTSSQYPILAYCAPKPEADLSWDNTRTEHCPLREATQWGRTLGKR